MTIGIAVSRDQLLAIVVEEGLPEPRVSAAVSVPCREPFGGPEDAAALAAALRDAVPGDSLPGAVITLPPPLTYLRLLKLPVTDLKRARAIHVAELEGNLPIEDDEILSDLLPSSPETPDLFLAVASRRSLVENTVGSFQAAGIRVDLVVTDHAALLTAASGAIPDNAMLLSAVSDILLMRVSGGGVRAARQFPIELAENPDVILSAANEAAGDGPLPPFVAVGDPPPSISGIFPGLTPMPLPPEVPASHIAAYGAALAPRRADATGGFSLRTSAEAAAEKIREGRKARIAVIAAIVAAVMAIMALEFSVWVGGRKLDKVRAQARKEFAEVAPDVKLRDATAAVQIREKLASVQRIQKELGVNAPPPADLLSIASASLPDGDIAVREAAVEGGRVRIAAETGDSRLVEAYRAALSKSLGPGYSATLQGTEAGLKSGAVKFTILVERKEVRRAS